MFTALGDEAGSGARRRVSAAARRVIRRASYLTGLVATAAGVSDGPDIQPGTAASSGPHERTADAAPAPSSSTPSLKARRWHPGRSWLGPQRPALGGCSVVRGRESHALHAPDDRRGRARTRARYIAPLGQAGFFMSAIFLPRLLGERVNLMLILFDGRRRPIPARRQRRRHAVARGVVHDRGWA